MPTADADWRADLRGHGTAPQQYARQNQRSHLSQMYFFLPPRLAILATPVFFGMFFGLVSGWDVSRWLRHVVVETSIVWTVGCATLTNLAQRHYVSSIETLFRSFYPYQCATLS